MPESTPKNTRNLVVLEFQMHGDCGIGAYEGMDGIVIETVGM